MNRRGNRNPLDLKIDELSPEAISILKQHKGLHLIVPHINGSLPEAIHELLELDFFQLKDSRPNETQLTITFQGNNAQLRLNGGVYDAQKPKAPPKPGITDESMDEMLEWAMF
jgi:hypothetical protein